MYDLVADRAMLADRANKFTEITGRGYLPLFFCMDVRNSLRYPVHRFIVAFHREWLVDEYAVAKHVEPQHVWLNTKAFLDIGGIGVQLASVLEQRLLQRVHGLGFMVDDADSAGILIPKDQIGDAHKTIAADVDLKLVLNRQDLLIAKPIEAVEIRQPFVVILAGQTAGKGRKVMLDRLIVFGDIHIRKLEGHQLSFGPAFQYAVTMGAVFGVGILFLRHFVDILQLKCQWTAIVA